MGLVWRQPISGLTPSKMGILAPRGVLNLSNFGTFSGVDFCSFRDISMHASGSLRLVKSSLSEKILWDNKKSEQSKPHHCVHHAEQS